MVPVVDDLRTFDFCTVPASHRALGTRNAVGLEPDGGRRVVDAVRGYLGLESFTRDRQLFISYRRSDGQQIADQIEPHLWSERYMVFLDTRQVAGGEVVQDTIMQDLQAKDFVLLIDTPDAGQSRWVQAELIEALRCRVPVCAVRSDPDTCHLSLAADIPYVNWNDDPQTNRCCISRLVSRGIAARTAWMDA